MQSILSAESIAAACEAEGVTEDEYRFSNKLVMLVAAHVAVKTGTPESKKRILRATAAIMASSLMEHEPATLPDQADRWMDSRAPGMFARRTVFAWTCFIAVCAVATFIVWKISGGTV